MKDDPQGDPSMHRFAITIAFVVSAASLLGGCAAAAIHIGMHAIGQGLDAATAPAATVPDSHVIADPYGPKAVFETRNFSLDARLDPRNRAGKRPLIVCLSPQGWGPRANRPVMASLDPRQIFLSQSEARVGPAGYAVQPECPDPGDPTRKPGAPVFSEIDPKNPIVMRVDADRTHNHVRVRTYYSVVWLRFDVEQEAAIENIALHLGTVTVDGREHAAQPSKFDHPWHLKAAGHWGALGIERPSR